MKAVLSLGSNLGDRQANLQAAVDALFGSSAAPSARPRLAALSPVYETAPVGGPRQGPFLNAVAIAHTAVPPEELLKQAQAVEDALGRVRHERWGPRVVDIDIIVCGEELRSAPQLVLPHPRAHERAFVLRPWADLDPGACVPGRGRVAELLGAVADQQLHRRAESALWAPG